MARPLRNGYTTGACAAAAAKAAATCLLTGEKPDQVEIPFPDGSRHCFPVHLLTQKTHQARAGIIKDAGDDPDVTNGALIEAMVSLENKRKTPENALDLDNILLWGGSGIGRATKPGLAIKVGEPAINPIPRQMIAAAVKEAAANRKLLVEIAIANGEELAEKTLNHRLGIIGGLSILGTTGIVRPVSAEAWTATIQASMDVARACGLDEIVLATGRTSERGAQAMLDLGDEAYTMMGDYLKFSLQAAAEHGFSRIHLAGMWAKITKAALAIPQTHVRNGALEMKDAAALLADLGAEGELLSQIEQANTAREMLIHLQRAGKRDIIRAVCTKARDYAEKTSGLPVNIYLVDHKARVLEYV